MSLVAVEGESVPDNDENDLEEGGLDFQEDEDDLEEVDADSEEEDVDIGRSRSGILVDVVFVLL